MMSNNTLVPVITSGAARSPDFPETPTISGVTGDRVDFTTSVDREAAVVLGKVGLHSPFYLGTTEVTFAQYDAFARATGRAPADDSGWAATTAR
jgi:formylglycine-generating enzyme required for sulfatase activity